MCHIQNMRTGTVSEKRIAQTACQKAHSSGNGWQGGETPAILCPKDIMTGWFSGGTVENGCNGEGNSGSQMLGKYWAAELTSSFQLFQRESSVPRSKVVIVSAKDILSQLSIF